MWVAAGIYTLYFVQRVTIHTLYFVLRMIICTLYFVLHVIMWVMAGSILYALYCAWSRG